MDTGLWLTRGSVWMALSLYVAGEVLRATGRNDRPVGRARWLNAVGCGFFLVHVACAFHFHHHWSHAEALAETARQTAELVGWDWSGGLFFNYAFTLLWLGEVIWSWADPMSHAMERRWMTWSVRGFFLFMMVNGAVVFVPGRMRWFGLFLCLTLTACWLLTGMPAGNRIRSRSPNIGS